MASASVQPSSAPPVAPLPLLQSAGRAMFAGLLWGGILLIVLGLWLGYKTAEGRVPVVGWVVGILGVVSLGLAAWHALTLWLQKLPDDQKASVLAAQRRITGLALLGGGAVLLVIAAMLAFVQIGGDAGTGRFAALFANFGEAAGLLLFSCVALWTGKTLLGPPREPLATIDVEPIRNLFPPIRISLFVAGVALIGVFIFLAFIKKIGLPYFPELAGILMFSMLCMAVGLWLTTIPHPDAFTTRIFVLVFGGTTGLILFIMSLGRTYAWSSQVFGGVATWQGEDAWRLWLCVYFQLFALALMFGCLVLARSDIRSNVILRRVLFGYKAGLEGLLLLEGLVILNIVFYTLVPYSFDWTQSRGLHALSESSKNLLRELKQPTHVYVLMSQNTITYNEVRNLLDNMQAESNKVTVNYMSPDSNPLDYESLAQRFPQILPGGANRMMGDEARGVLMVYGEMPKEPNHKVPYTFVQDKKLFDQQGMMQGAKPKRVFKGEAELMKELNFLVHNKDKKKICFLQGDDELDITENATVRRVDPRDELSLFGAGQLVDRLKKDNYEVQAITFSKLFAAEKKKAKDDVLYVGEGGPEKKAEIPKDTYAVIVLGASQQIPPDALAALDHYMDRGGRMMVFFESVLTSDVKAIKMSGLEGFVKKYGIDSTDEFILRVINQQGVDPFKVVATAPPKSDNALAKQFLRVGFDFRTARAIRPAAAPTGKYRATPVLNTVPQLTPAVAEKDVYQVMKDPIRYLLDLQDQKVLEERATTPLPVVVAVSEDDKGRMVVFGDTEFVSNLGLLADRRDLNYSLFVSALEWMADREVGGGFIGPRPKTTESFALDKTVAAEYMRIHMFPMWLMFLGIIGLGTGVWLVRRR